MMMQVSGESSQSSEIFLNGYLEPKIYETLLVFLVLKND